MSDEVLQIRSFRVVFDLERRIHRIDRFRVPLPYGLPLRSVGYAAAVFAAVLVLQPLPLVGGVLGTLAAPVRFVLLPVGASLLLSRLRIDGRSAHAAALAWLRFAASPRRYVAFRPARARSEVRLGDLTLARTLPVRTGRLGGRGALREPGEQLALLPDDQPGLW